MVQMTGKKITSFPNLKTKSSIKNLKIDFPSIIRRGDRKNMMNFIVISSFLLINWNANVVAIFEDFSPLYDEVVSGKFPAKNLESNSTKLGASVENHRNVREKSWHVPIRREIRESWPPHRDLGDYFPWNYDSYYPRKGKFIAEYGDYSSLSPSLAQNGDASLHEIDQVIGPRNHPRNKYLATGGNYGKPETHDFDEQANKRRTNQHGKHISKNTCRQYLEFLKYAFESLDETPENRYEQFYDHRGNYGEKPGRDYFFSNGKPFAFNPYERPPSAGKLPRVNIKEIYPENSESKSTTSIRISSSTIPTWGNFFSGSTTAAPGSSTATVIRIDQEPVTTVPPWSTAIGQTVKEPTREMFSTTPNQTESPKMSSTTQGFASTSEDSKITPTNLTESKRTGAPEWIFPNSKQKSLELGVKWKTLTVATTNFPEGRDTAEDGCNDKMLPCPDTFNVTYPLNGYCNRFVSCESGRAMRRTCPEGLYFNVVTKSCDLPHNSFCNYACPSAYGYYGIPGDCGGYFACENYFPVYNMCPPKMHWSNAKETCTFAEWSDCPMKCSAMNEIKRYEGDCKAYVVCLNWFPYYQKCPPNTKFDEFASTCIPEHLSDCEDDPKLVTKMLNPFFVRGNE